MKIEDVKKLPVQERFLYWIKERESIRLKKEAGEPKPWTDDEILQSYRFCNVHREHDHVTKWISENWRNPNQGHKNLWFAMAVARMFNWPDTLAEIRYPHCWDLRRVKQKLERREQRGDKIWTGAYLVSTNGVRMGKVDYVLRRVLTPLWQGRESLRPTETDSLASFAKRLMAYNGFKGFMTGQVVADTKYAEPLWYAEDWGTWAISGPGSRRGLNRLIEQPINQSWKESKWFETLCDLRRRLKIRGMHNQDLQNCLCEFDKYERCLWGEGRPRNKYQGV